MDLRDLIAETLAGHEAQPSRVVGDTLRPFPAVLNCGGCDWSMAYDHLNAPEVAAEHRRHVADVLLAALGERVLPEGGETREEWQRFGAISPCATWERERCANEPEVHKRRLVTSWPGGSQFIGPWRPVDTEETP